MIVLVINAPVGLLLGRVDLTMFTAKFATLSCLIGLKSLAKESMLSFPRAVEGK